MLSFLYIDNFNCIIFRKNIPNILIFILIYFYYYVIVLKNNKYNFIKNNNISKKL